MQSLFNQGKSPILTGDRVKVSTGNHAGKLGTVVSTRGTHMHNFVFVQLDKIVQGRQAVGGPHPADRISVSIRHVDKL